MTTENQTPAALENPAGNIVDRATMPRPGTPIDMTDEQSAEFAARFQRLYRESVDYREAEWDETNRLKKIWLDYRSGERYRLVKYPVSGPKGEPMSAQYKIATLAAVMDVLTAQWLQPIENQTPLVTVAPGGPDEEQDAKDVEDYLAHVYADIVEYNGVNRDWLFRTGMEGVGVLHVGWECSTAFQVDRETGTAAWERVRDSVTLNVIERERVHLWPPKEHDLQKAAFLFVRRDITASELHADRCATDDDGKPASVYQISDAQWDSIKNTIAPGGDGAPEMEDDGWWTVGHALRAVDVYGNVPLGKQKLGRRMGVPGGEYPCLFTILLDHTMCIRKTTRKRSRKPFVAKYAYKPGKRFIGPSVPDKVESVVKGIEQTANRAQQSANLAMLIARTILADVDADIDLTGIGGIIPCRNPEGIKQLAIPPVQDVSMFDFWKDILGFTTGVSNEVLGESAPVGTSTVSTQGAIGLGSIVFQQSVSLQRDADREAAVIIAETIHDNAEDVIEYFTATTDAEQDDHRTEQVQKANDVRIEMAQMSGDDPNAIPPPEMEEPPAAKKRSITAKAFKPTLRYAIAGAKAANDPATELQEWETLMNFLMPAGVPIPLLAGHEDRIWELINFWFEATRNRKAEKVLGVKPDPADAAMQQQATGGVPNGVPPMGAAPGAPVVGGGVPGGPVAGGPVPVDPAQLSQQALQQAGGVQ